MAKPKTDLQKAAEEQAAVAITQVSVIKNRSRKNESQEIKVAKPSTPGTTKRRGRPTISGGEAKQEKRCTLYMTPELYALVDSMARIHGQSVNQFFLGLAKNEIEKPENQKMIEILSSTSSS